MVGEKKMICLCACLHIYKTCKISLEGYKRNIYHWLPLREKLCRGKGMELQSFHYLLICYHLNSKSCEGINYSTNKYKYITFTYKRGVPPPSPRHPTYLDRWDCFLPADLWIRDRRDTKEEESVGPRREWCRRRGRKENKTRHKPDKTLETVFGSKEKPLAS